MDFWYARKITENLSECRKIARSSRSNVGERRFVEEGAISLSFSLSFLQEKTHRGGVTRSYISDRIRRGHHAERGISILSCGILAGDDTWLLQWRLARDLAPYLTFLGFLVHAGRNEAILKARPVVEPRAHAERLPRLQPGECGAVSRARRKVHSSSANASTSRAFFISFPWTSRRSWKRRSRLKEDKKEKIKKRKQKERNAAGPTLSLHEVEKRSIDRTARRILLAHLVCTWWYRFRGETPATDDRRVV